MPLIASCRREFINVSSSNIIIPSHESSQHSSESGLTEDSYSKGPSASRESSKESSSAKPSSSGGSSSSKGSSSKPSSKTSSSVDPSTFTPPGHVCDPVVVQISEATCIEAAKYACQCRTCGKIFDEYTIGKPLGHDFEEKYTKVDDQYHTRKCKRCGHIHKEIDPNRVHLKTEGNCMTKSVYYKVCKDCVAVSKTKTFVGEFGEHSFTEQVVEDRYLKTREGSLFTNGSVYYKSCKHCKTSSRGKDEEPTFLADDIKQISFGSYPSTLATKSEEELLKNRRGDLHDIYVLSSDERFYKAPHDKKFYKIEPVIWNLNKIEKDSKGEEVYEVVTNDAVLHHGFVSAGFELPSVGDYSYIQSKLDDHISQLFLVHAFSVFNQVDLRKQVGSKFLPSVGERRVYILSKEEVIDEKEAGQFVKSAPIKNLKLTDYAKSFSSESTVPVVWTRSYDVRYEIEGAYTFAVENGKVTVEKKCHTMASLMPAMRLSKENFEKHLITK